MPTIGEACQRLGIGRVTLEKWMDRLHIVPEKHPQDWRYRVLTDEQVQRIADERAKMPGHINKHLYVALRSPSAGSMARDASLTLAPLPRQRPLQRDSFTALPDGMMSRSDAAEAHNVPLTTLRRWCDEGRVETHTGIYGGEHGRRPVIDPITRRGLAQFYALASSRADFTRCPQCPHADLEIAEGEG